MRAILLGIITFAACARVLAQTSPVDNGLAEKLLQPGNLAASTLLALNVIGFIRGWVVPSWVYQIEKERAERMEARAWSMAESLARSVEAVEKTTAAVIHAGEKSGTK